jgi:hypothetical protein
MPRTSSRSASWSARWTTRRSRPGSSNSGPAARTRCC